MESLATLRAALAPVFQGSEAVSCILYGSHARGDADTLSDYEVAFIFDASPPPGTRRSLSRLLGPDVKPYVFRRADLLALRPDVPFQPAFFCDELRTHGVVLFGADVVSAIPRGEIDMADCREELAFVRGRALDAILACRAGALSLAAELAFKSVYCVVRLETFLRHGELIHDRRRLTRWSDEAGSPRVRSFVSWARALRATDVDPTAETLYAFMSYLTRDMTNLVRDVQSAGRSSPRSR